jgi:hypothetical protein
MRARFINEADNVFKPRDKEDITLQAAQAKGAKEYTLKNGKTVWVYQDHFSVSNSPMVLIVIDEQGKRYFKWQNFDFKDDDKQYLENWSKHLTESLQDTFKPKSAKNILADLKKEFNMEKYNLKNGKTIWVYEDILREMAGEYIWVLYYIVEGETEASFVDEKIISQVKNDMDRRYLNNRYESVE